MRVRTIVTVAHGISAVSLRLIVRLSSEENNERGTVNANSLLRKAYKVQRAVRYFNESRALYVQGKDLFKRTKEKIDARTTWTVKVDSDSDTYDAVYRWFVGLERDSRVTRPYVKSEYKDRKIHQEVRFVADNSVSHTVTIGGYEVVVATESSRSKGGDVAPDDIPSISELLTSYSNTQEFITFRCRSEEAVEAVQTFLTDMFNEGKDKWLGRIRMLRGNYWSTGGTLVPRPLESVVLKEGVLEDLVEDVHDFLSSSDEYVKRGIPWHRGYLLYGDPGTGKTSTVKAIATKFEMDVYILQLSDVANDTALMEAVANIDDRSILLIEDIDAHASARTRKDNQGDQKSLSNLTLSGLLNVLDGMATPHGMITFMTTNTDINADDPILDRALLRRGRVDREIHVGYPDQEQINRLWGLFYPDNEGGFEFAGTPLPTASYYEIFKRNLYDPEFARIEVKNLLAEAKSSLLGPTR